jgi:hypothetical protein
MISGQSGRDICDKNLPQKARAQIILLMPETEKITSLNGDCSALLEFTPVWHHFLVNRGIYLTGKLISPSCESEKMMHNVDNPSGNGGIYHVRSFCQPVTC